jgi:AraC-like DNA-binding protein
LLTALRALGLDTADLCRRVGLRTALLRDPAGSVPVPVVAELLALAARRAGDPLVGLHAGACTQPRGPLFYLLISSPLLGEGLRQVTRFSHLAADRLRVRVKRGTGTVRLVIDPGEVAEESTHLVDYMMMALTRVLRIAVGAEFQLREVHVRHPPWSDLAEAAQVFGCPVWCNRSENRLVFPVEYLETASRGANPLIAKQIEKFSETRAAHATPPATFRQGVADAARELLAEGLRADRATVARQLHVSRRTLQRRLEEERTTFRAVRDAVLREVVEALLSNPLLKVEYVALSVGFADVAAFSKAFKRWAGCSPTAYRQRLTTAARRGKRLRVVRA